MRRLNLKGGIRIKSLFKKNPPNNDLKSQSGNILPPSQDYNDCPPGDRVTDIFLRNEKWKQIERGSDGNCLFPSLCYLRQALIDEHITLRQQTVEHMKSNLYYFFIFFETFNKDCQIS